MPIDLYNISIGDDVVAKQMPLQFALILTKAIYSEFYAEPNLKVTIEKLPPPAETTEVVKDE